MHSISHSRDQIPIVRLLPAGITDDAGAGAGVRVRGMTDVAGYRFLDHIVSSVRVNVCLIYRVCCLHLLFNHGLYSVKSECDFILLKRRKPDPFGAEPFALALADYSGATIEPVTVALPVTFPLHSVEVSPLTVAIAALA